MASVLRLAAIDLGEKSACTSFALPSAICCACARVTSGDVWTVSPSALATGASESACSVNEVLKLVGSGGELLPDLLPLRDPSRSAPSLRRTRASSPGVTSMSRITC